MCVPQKKTSSKKNHQNRKIIKKSRPYYLPHVGHERKNPQGPETPQQDKHVGRAVDGDLARRQVNEDHTDREDEEVEHAAKVLDHCVGREEEAVGAHLQRHLDRHEEDEEVLDDLELPGGDQTRRGRLAHHADAGLDGDEDHEPVQVGDEAEDLRI